MSKAAARGTKRYCQDEACGLPFYDLNRVDFTCPNCGADYKVVVPATVMPAEPRYPRRSGWAPAQVAQEAKLEPKSEVAADPEDEIETEEVELEKDDSIKSLLEPDDDDVVELPIHPNGEDNVKD